MEIIALNPTYKHAQWHGIKTRGNRYKDADMFGRKINGIVDNRKALA